MKRNQKYKFVFYYKDYHYVRCNLNLLKRDRIIGKVVYVAVISAMADFDSPAIFLNDTSYLKEIIRLLYFVFKVDKLESQKFFLFFQSVHHTESSLEIPFKETYNVLVFNW